MSELTLKSFNIDSTMELIADHYGAEAPDSSAFRAASISDRVTLKMGLLDQSNSPLLVGHIEQGVIDEYEIVIQPNSIVGHLRGRDPSALLLDRFFKKIYRREPVASETPVQTDIPEVRGRFMASQIAADAVAVAGLTLAWEVRDYELLMDFQADARVIDVLRALIRPWTLVDPFRADIFIQGTTLIIRHRSFPPTPDYLFTLANARRSTLTVRKRRAKKVGKLTLRGKRITDTLEPTAPGDAGIGGLFGSGEAEVSTLNEKFDADGVLLSREVNTFTFRMPDKILLKHIKSTYTVDESGALSLSSRETIINEWEATIYDESGPKNAPKQKTQTIKRERVDPSDDAGIFRVWETEHKGFSYDAENFETGETTLTKKLDLDLGALQRHQLVVKTTKDVGPLLAEQITEQYDFNVDQGRWAIRSRDGQISGGHRPGGPGRANPKMSDSSQTTTEGGSRQITVTRTLSTDPDAVDIEFSDESMSEEDLNFIADQFERAQGLWEYELLFGGVSMPWIRRGVVIEFVDIFAEDGSTITLPVALITEVRSRYDESSAQPQAIMDVRAFGWSAA